MNKNIIIGTGIILLLLLSGCQTENLCPEQKDYNDVLVVVSMDEGIVYEDFICYNRGNNYEPLFNISYPILNVMSNSSEDLYTIYKTIENTNYRIRAPKVRAGNYDYLEDYEPLQSKLENLSYDFYDITCENNKPIFDKYQVTIRTYDESFKEEMDFRDWSRLKILCKKADRWSCDMMYDYKGINDAYLWEEELKNKIIERATR